MRGNFYIRALLMVFIVIFSLSVLLNASAESGYTTTVTERYTTVLTSTKTETLETTTTDYVTRTEVMETYIETQRVIVTPTMVLVPTQIVTVSPCDVPPCALEPMTVTKWVRVWINSPTTVKSLITSSTTITVTSEETKVDNVIKTKTELITLTLENVYTSVSTPPQTATTQPESNINSLLSSNLMWILLIIIIILVVVLMMRLRRPRAAAPAPRAAAVYCIKCGTPISAEAKKCPECGASQI